MYRNPALQDLSRDELISLVEMYAKNWLAIDGYWFQSIERKYGLDAAMWHDVDVWRGYTRTEARRIKSFLGLPAQPGLEGLEKAFKFRAYANINHDETAFDRGSLLYRTLECRVQRARAAKGLPCHPCKAVGIVEFGDFANEIDPRIRCECVSCYPDVTDKNYNCVWRFWIGEA